jgi:heat shock protein HslJ
MNWRIWMLLMLVVGCGEEELALEKRAFLLSSAQGFTPVTGTTVRLHFEDGQLNAHADCNSMFGEYTVRDGTLVVGGLGSTARGCEPGRAAQDQFIGDFLASQPKIALEQNQLTLTGTNATLVLLDREVADPDRPLVGTRWVVDTLIENDGASSLPGQADPTLQFRTDGVYEVDTTCNQVQGHYELGDSELSLSNYSTTQAACSGAAGSLDAHLQRVFKLSKLKVRIEARHLTLGDDKLGIAANAE